MTTSATSTAQLPKNNDPFNEEREQIHRRMLSVVAHDLKTPLASIIGSLEIFDRMGAKLPADRQQALIRIALQESYRLETLITNVLDMAKLENDVIKPIREPIDLEQTINMALRPFSNRFARYNLRPPSSTCGSPITDAVLLSRVIGLVLDNAIKHGGIPAEAHIDYGLGADDLFFITIRDNGAGVPDDQQEAIFAKYTQGREDERASTNSGTGLGLAISREIMALLGGTISVKNAQEGGAAFTLRFPST